MKKLRLVLGALVALVTMSSCTHLGAVQIKEYEKLDDFTHFYIIPTSSFSSTKGSTFGDSEDVYGYTSSRTVNPSDMIAGYLTKQGFVRLAEVSPELSDKTLIVSFGESNRRETFFFHVFEVTLQFLSAKTNLPVCVCTAEGEADNESEAVRHAISRCLDTVFAK